MNEQRIPEMRQASDQGFEHLAVFTKERGETMLLLARLSLEINMKQHPESVDLEKSVAIPYVGTVRLGSLLELRQE